MTVMKPLLAALVLTLCGAVALGAAQGPRSSPPPLVPTSTYGADLYQFYCAGCHGATARGGPVRSLQHRPAPDLTSLARRNNGAFPRERVRSTITFGRTGSVQDGAHGSADMPVWGAVFRSLDPSDALTAIRIENLVKYLESLQQTAEVH